MTGNNSFSLTSTGTGLTAPVVVLNGLNFNPVVRFTGSGTNGYRLLGNTSITMSEASVAGSWAGDVMNNRGAFFSPINNGGAGNSRYYFWSASKTQLWVGFGPATSGPGYLMATPPDSNVPVVLTASGTGSGSVLNMNGLDAHTGSVRGGYTSTTMTDIPQIGDRSTSDGKMNGDIAEIVAASRGQTRPSAIFARASRAKWKTVRVEKARQIKNLEPVSIASKRRALGATAWCTALTLHI